jgi:carboxymethylenebutenolidase
MGGMYALLAGCEDERLAACVSWYGMLRYADYDANNPASPLDVAAQLHCPLLGLYGEDDALIPLADVAALRTVLADAGKTAHVRTYPGAGHAFFNDTRSDAYRPAAAADAWSRALAFLGEHLGKTG